MWFPETRIRIFGFVCVQFLNCTRALSHVCDRLCTCDITLIQFRTNDRVRVILHVYDRLYTCNIARKRSFVCVYDRLHTCTSYYTFTIVCVHVLLCVYDRLCTCNTTRVQTKIVYVYYCTYTNDPHDMSYTHITSIWSGADSVLGQRWRKSKLFGLKKDFFSCDGHPILCTTLYRKSPT
jgi:hypothetical protein